MSTFAARARAIDGSGGNGFAGAAVGDAAPAARPRKIASAVQQLGRDVPGHHVVIAPDGSTLAYIAAVNSVPVMYARRFDSFDSILLAQPALFPFFRPDGKEVGFLNQNIIRRVAITSGPIVDVAPIEGQFRGATWGPDGNIVFSTSVPETGLLRVSAVGAAGAKPETLTTPAAGFDHIWPRFLPDGNLLFTIVSTSNSAAMQLAVLDMRSSPPRTIPLLSGGSDAHYLPSGHLLYLAGDSIRLVGFDLSTLKLTDEPPPAVLSDMFVSGSGDIADFALSQSGTAVYVRAATATTAERTLVTVDSTGRNERLLHASARTYLYPRVSPDETRVAVDVREDQNDLWVLSLANGTFTKVTQNRGRDRAPVWADNEYLYYSSESDGTPTVYRQRADGTGQPQGVTDVVAGEPLFPLSMAGDRLIVSNMSGGLALARLFTLAVGGASSPAAKNAANGTSPKASPLPALELLVKGAGGVLNGTVSPDGRWLAYQSNESGRWDVFVQPYGADATGPRQAISPMGGIQPRWSADGRELFYVSPANEMMVVRVTPGAQWSASAPQRLFDASRYYFGTAGSPYFMYDVMRDGRFVMVKSPAGAATAAQTGDHIYVIENWIEELKKLSTR